MSSLTLSLPPLSLRPLWGIGQRLLAHAAGAKQHLPALRRAAGNKHLHVEPEGPTKKLYGISGSNVRIPRHGVCMVEISYLSTGTLRVSSGSILHKVWVFLASVSTP